MGLFSRFSFADAPHKGDPMSERPPASAKRGLFGLGTPDANGLTGFDKINLMGASMRDEPAAGEGAMQMLKMRQQQALLKQKQAAQQQLGSIFGGGGQAASPGILPIGDFQGVAPKAAAP